MKRLLLTSVGAFFLLFFNINYSQAQCPGSSASTKSVTPFTITFQTSAISNDEVELTFKVQNTDQSSNFEYVAFQLPINSTAIQPIQTYTGEYEFDPGVKQVYLVENPSTSPSGTIKFFTSGNHGKFKSGTYDIFKYKIKASELANMTSLMVSAKAKNRALSNINFEFKNGNELLPCVIDVRQPIVNNSTGNIAGEANPLVGSSQIYTIQSSATLAYTWIVPEGWSIVSAVGNTLNVKVGEISGEVRVVMDELNTNNEKNGVTINRELAVSPYSNPLPVELVSFTGVTRNGSVELSWKTATEINNDRFEIERSTNGKDFKKIGSVKGAGNSSILLSYKFIDGSPLAGVGYYRLKQVDTDLAFEYSKVIAVKASGVSQQMEATLFPNPVVDNQLTVRVKNFNQSNGTLEFKLTDLSGKVVLFQNLNLEHSETRVNLLPYNLKKGMYLASVAIDGNTRLQRIVIQ